MVRFDRTKRNIEDKVDQLPFTPACHQAHMDDEFEGAEYGAGFRVNLADHEINGDGDVGFLYGRGSSAQEALQGGGTEFDVGAYFAAVGDGSGRGGAGESSGELSDGDENL